MGDVVGNYEHEPQSPAQRFRDYYEAEKAEFRKENVLAALGTMSMVGAIMAGEHVGKVAEAGLGIGGGVLMAASVVRPLIRRLGSTEA